MKKILDLFPNQITKVSFLFLIFFNLFSIVGFSVFIQNPSMLSKFPNLVPLYVHSFSFFAQGQMIFSLLVTLLFLHRYVQTAFWKTLLSTFLITLFFEWCGVTYGFPFGSYEYSNLLGPKFDDKVPYLIPISWFYMAFCGYSLATWIFPEKKWKRILFASFLLTQWDFTLDPAMSYLTNYWTWLEPGPFYTMPYQNWLGWYLTSFFVMLFFEILQAKFWTQKIPKNITLLLYLTHLALPLGMVFAGLLWYSILLGFLGIGLLLFLLRKTKA